MANSTNSVGFPHLVQVQPWGHTAIVGTWANRIDVSAIKTGYLDNLSTQAQNDEVEWDITLGPGTWDIQLIGLGISTAGIVTVQIDGSSVGTLDFYDAGGTQNTSKTLTGVTVSEGGPKLLTFLMATKNASSSSYRLAVSVISLRRTGA